MDTYLLIVTFFAIVIVILGVSLFKWHAFISLTVASLFLAVLSGMKLEKIVHAYEIGVGGVLGHLVGILAFGTILGKMLSESGAGLQIAKFFEKVFGEKKLPWAMFLSGFIVGIPVFFEVGILILLPLVISIQKTTKKNLLLIGLPAVTGLSVAVLVPPQPGSIAAVGIYGANLGKVLLYAIMIAIPSGIVAGPLFAKWIYKRVIPSGEPNLVRIEESADKKNVPSVGISFLTVLMPVILMVFGTLSPYMLLPDEVERILKFIGSPLIALLISCFVSFYFLGFRQGLDKMAIKKFTDACIAPVASILLIIGAGGGFKQILIDSGVGTTIANMSEQLSLSPLVLAFLTAGLIRVATGSATVALTTAAGIVSPIVATMSGINLELLVIATGAGSLMLSHVNDAGFWMVKEYLGLSIEETFKTWTVLETIISFVAFGSALLLNMFI